MTDLTVNQADIDATRTSLNAAAAPIVDVCIGADAVGSTLVASAISEVDSIVRTILTALTGAAEAASTDVGVIGTALDDTDAALAGENP